MVERHQRDRYRSVSVVYYAVVYYLRVYYAVLEVTIELDE